MQFDVNLSILFADRPLLQRFRAAAAQGFRAVELWWPFETAAPAPSDVDRLVDAIGEAGLSLACLNFDGGDFTAGERGLVSLASATARFRDNVDVAVAIAGLLDCRRLNALYGNRNLALAESAQRAIAVANLAFAAERAAAVGARVVVEALNPREFPAYGLQSASEAVDLVEAAHRDAGAEIAVLLDVYHVARGGHDPVREIGRCAPHIGHVQIADVPGRGRPGSGTLPFGAIFAALDAAGYDGYVGLEYVASRAPEDTFGWLTGTPLGTSIRI